jgi:hypothetical protein
MACGAGGYARDVIAGYDDKMRSSLPTRVGSSSILLDLSHRATYTLLAWLNQGLGLRDDQL